MLQIRKAQRQQGKIKLALQGTSGAGKTYSSLLLAKGLIQTLEKVVVIDTESSSADLYDFLGDYSVLTVDPPFTPEKYIEAIKACENAGFEVLILDSISPEWSGSGGILEIHGSMPGNSFTNWKSLSARHNHFLNAILQSHCHVIATMRTKQAYVLNQVNGKAVPEKIGFKAICREGTEYEFTTVFEINQKHYCTASKDRTNLFADKPEFIITESTGKLMREWCIKGLPISQPETKNLSQQFKLTSNGTHSQPNKPHSTNEK